MQKTGAYLLYLDVQQPLALDIGTLENSYLPEGRYVYVGSAVRGIAQRIARHLRLAARKTGKVHWHIDWLLTNPNVRLVRAKMLAESCECELSQSIERRKGVTAPVPRFGSTDCKAGCKAHLYRIHARTGLQRRPTRNHQTQH